MILRDRTFRHRITIAFALLAAAVCFFFAMAVVGVFQAIEKHLFSQRLMAELKWTVAQMDTTGPMELSPTRHFYPTSYIPSEWQSLAPGYYDIENSSSSDHIAIIEKSGQRYMLVSDESDFEHLESLLYIALFIGGLAGTSVAVWLGHIMAGRIIAPLTQLADAISSEKNEGELPGLQAADEIGELARTFAVRSEELREYWQRERLFTGDVSHELRTPLTVILGGAEIISYHAQNQPTLAAAADRIRRATQEMTDRVQAFLLLSRSPEQLDVRAIALLPIIKREIDRYQPLLSGKPVQCILDCAQDVVVSARPELASMAIGNLIRNACQYTEMGHIKITLCPDAIIVEDTGSGLPSDVQAHLFERLPRRKAQSVSGSGLGLAIVKRIADHLAWRISWEKTSTDGSRFILKFSQDTSIYESKI